MGITIKLQSMQLVLVRQRWLYNIVRQSSEIVAILLNYVPNKDSFPRKQKCIQLKANCPLQDKNQNTLPFDSRMILITK